MAEAGFTLYAEGVVIGVLLVELFIPDAHSLKDRRSVVKSLKEQAKGRFNIAIAELTPDDKWQRASLGVTTVGGDRRYVDGCLREVVEWMRNQRLAELIRVEQEIL